MTLSLDSRTSSTTPQDTALKVLYLWDADYPWDVRTQKVCAALTSGGHDVHIVARNKRRSPIVERLPEGIVHRMKPWRWIPNRADSALSFPAFFNPRWRSLLDGVTRELAPDLLIVRDLPLCPLAISVGRRRSIPVMLDMAENYTAMMQEIWDAGRQRWFDVLVRNPRVVAGVERYCLPRLQHVLTVVEESSERILGEHIAAERVSVVSNTPPRERASTAVARRRETDQPLHLVYLGLMEIPRGVGDLLDATAHLVSQGRSLRLTLIGSGRDEPIFRSQAERLGLQETVTFRGYVPNHDALALVAAADVGIVPHHANASWNSTIPNKLFDYMAAGLPVVSSDAIPCARVIHETKAGEVFRSGDPMDLARVLERFFDANARQKCGEAGRSAVQTRYNWEEATSVLLRAVAATAAAGGQRRTTAHRAS